MVNNPSKNQNGGGAVNQKKRRFYKKPNNNKPNGNGIVNGSNNKVQSKREMKFHMHDAQARRSSESYEKIKKAILLRIQESFDDLSYIVESLRKNEKKVLVKPNFKDYISSLECHTQVLWLSITKNITKDALRMTEYSGTFLICRCMSLICFTSWRMN